MKTPRIVIVGSSNTDMVVKADRIPGVGETVTGGQFVMVPGGKGANQAVAAARLGAQVTFVAKVGQDLLGSQAIAGYQKENILTDWITVDSALPTGVALILVGAQGDNLISVASGANHALRPADVDKAADQIRHADMLVLQLEIPLETVEHAAALAAGAGVPVLLDPAPAPAGPLPHSLLKNVTYLKPNETEAERLTGVRVVDENSARQAGERLLAAGAKHVMITLGAKGAVVIERPGESHWLAAFPVEAVDSTAAGDAFSGALACALARGDGLLQAARYASLVGGLSTTKLGAQPSLPTEAELREYAELIGVHL